MSFMGKAGFAVAALSLAAGSVLGAGSASAESLYGAIAFSPGQNTYEATYDRPSREAAEASALALCGYDDCEVATWWSNGCGAVVWNDQGWTGVASGSSRSEAVRNAIDKVSEEAPIAMLANFGSSDLSGTRVIDVVCSSNAR